MTRGCTPRRFNRDFTSIEYLHFQADHTTAPTKELHNRIVDRERDRSGLTNTRSWNRWRRGSRRPSSSRIPPTASQKKPTKRTSNEQPEIHLSSLSDADTEAREARREAKKEGRKRRSEKGEDRTERAWRQGRGQRGSEQGWSSPPLFLNESSIL